MFFSVFSTLLAFCKLPQIPKFSKFFYETTVEMKGGGLGVQSSG